MEKSMNIGHMIAQDLIDEITMTDFLAEGVYDPGIFKAIFLAGGPGSGKSKVASDILGVPEKGLMVSYQGLKLINSDFEYERLLKHNGYGTDLMKLPYDVFKKLNDSDNPLSLRNQAKQLTAKKFHQFLHSKLGVIIDRTGRNFESITQWRNRLNELGYDTMMVFVNTRLEKALERNASRPRQLPEPLVAKLWHKAQDNLGKFYAVFGDDMVIVDNNGDLVNGEVPIPKQITSEIRKFVTSPVENHIGKMWIKAELELKKHGLSEAVKTDNQMKLVGVYSGRFQPFGKHHYETYKQLKNVTGDLTYIATSDVTEPPRSPFNFNEKKKIIARYGIPTSRIVKTKSPYAPTEIISTYDEKTTALVLIFGEKDAGRLGGKGKYYLPYAGNEHNLKGYRDHGYYIIANHVAMDINGEELSGSTIRKLFSDPTIGKEGKELIFQKIFGWYDKSLYDLIVGKVTTKLTEEMLSDFVVCEICKKNMSQIQYRHLKYVHNMTMIEYKEKYPNSKLVSNSAKCFGDKNPMKDEESKQHFLEVVQSNTYREKQRVLSTGRKHTDESKRWMSENNSMHSEVHRKTVSRTVKQSYVDNPNLIELRSEHFSAYRNSDDYKENLYNLGLWKRPEEKETWERYYNAVKIITENNYRKYFYEIPNAKLRGKNFHLDHMVSIDYGFRNGISPYFIGHVKNLRVIPHSLNESKGRKNSKSFSELLTDIVNSGENINGRVLLLCGGAAGHLAHPFDDKELSFQDFKNIVQMSLEGYLDKEEPVQEKLDGQALSISWKNNKLVAARNKGHLKNQGALAPDIEGIKAQFAGRGDVTDAFTFAMEDLQTAIANLTDKQKTDVFQDGKNFMELEIIFPKTQNVIPYGTSMLIFHGVKTYDNNGNVVGHDKGAARMLAGMIRQINQNVQKNFAISGPKVLSIPKHKDFAEKQSYFIKKIDTLRNQFKLKDSDTVALYHQKWWEDFINRKASSVKYAIPNMVLSNLIARWAFYDKSVSKPNLLKMITNDKFKSWVSEFDSTDYPSQMKKNMLPFELLFLELGVEVLKNASGFISANPDKTVQTLKTDLQNAVQQLKKSKDLKTLEKVRIELEKIKALGGFDAIVPAEGLVFFYKGKMYKFTGSFAPVNQLLGILKYND